MSVKLDSFAGFFLSFAAFCLMGTKAIGAETLYQTTTWADLGQSEAWSDESTLAVAGKHYALEKLSDGSEAKLCMPTGVETYTFAGESLTIGTGCSFVFMRESRDNIAFICKKMCLQEGASVAGNSAKCSFTLGASGGTSELNLSGAVEIRAGTGKNVRIYSDITGDGVLKLCGWKNGTAPYGTYYLRGNNYKFLGRIDTSRKNTTGMSFDSGFSVLDIAGRKNLGGTLPALDPKAIMLADYVNFVTGDNESIKLEKASNRGVAVITGAQISNAKDFEIETKLALYGELRKYNAGKLILSGQATGFGLDGTLEKPESQNGYIKNVLKIYEGGLVIGSTDAIRSVSVGLAAGTTFELRPDFGNEEFLRYGIRNNTMAEPFKLGSGLTSLPFSIVAAKGKPKSGVPFRMGLFTVSTKCKQIDLIRQSVAGIQYPIRGFEGKLVENVDEVSGEVTFAIDYKPKGIHIVVR